MEPGFGDYLSALDFLQNRATAADFPAVLIERLADIDVRSDGFSPLANTDEARLPAFS